MPDGVWPALAVIVTFGISLAHVVFKSGQLTSRVEALEEWRERMRSDMHEVSDDIKELGQKIGAIHILIEERTERRTERREPV